jgi:hypothetical protein
VQGSCIIYEPHPNPRPQGVTQPQPWFCVLVLPICPHPAGVSAAFDAPATGALFAIEFVLKSSRLGLDRLSTSTVFAATSVSAGVVGFLRSQGQALGITGAATHLVGRIPYFSVNPNLLTDVLQVGCCLGFEIFRRNPSVLGTYHPEPAYRHETCCRRGWRVS